MITPVNLNCQADSEPPTSADVVIIGSGAGGGTLSFALRHLGARVVVLERGQFLPREFENWDANSVFVDNRYKTDERWLDGKGKSFRPGMQYWVGGNTKVYGSSLPRFRVKDFEATEHADGVSPAWPLRYEQYEPYYTAAEELYLVHGSTQEDHTDPPRSKPFPFEAIEDEPVIAELRSRLRRAGYEAAHIPLGIDRRKGGACIRCATCDGFPCLLDAKADSDVRGIRPAIAHGVQLFTGCFVERILTSPDGKTATAIEYELNGQTRRMTAGTIVVSAGAVNSAALLLRSRSSVYPDGLANRSGQVGRNYMVHNNTVMAAFGRIKNTTKFQKTLYVNDYYDKGNSRHPYPLGHIQLIGKTQAAMLKGQARLVPTTILAEAAARSTDWWLFTEDLPVPENRVTTDGRQIQVTWKPNNLEAHDELVRETKKMLYRVGYPLVIGKRMGIEVNSHQAGTIRMGIDPSTSVLDTSCRSHDVENLYVVDSSFFPSLPVMNPALTIAANALRVAEQLQQTLGVSKQTSSLRA
jgi:choline dehydrogenase-like flavoprotein